MRTLTLHRLANDIECEGVWRPALRRCVAGCTYALSNGLRRLASWLRPAVPHDGLAILEEPAGLRIVNAAGLQMATLLGVCEGGRLCVLLPALHAQRDGSGIRPVLPTIQVPPLLMRRADGFGVDFSPGPTPDVDRVLATTLFTDIVRSTEHLARVGDRAWHDVLARYQALVRHELASFRGREVDAAGDGFFAVFDTPARGVRCAMSIQEAARRLGIVVRAGVHTGEIELDGDAATGIAVHIGARICTLAGAYETLVSSTVKDLVCGSGLRFEDRGAHELKGVPDEWRLYAAS